MKSLFLSALTLFLSVYSLSAADQEKNVPYTATVTGVVCASCKAHISHAFKKLPGVEEVKFAPGEKDGTQVVSFNAATDALVKEDVVKALGEEAKRYQILEVQKEKL